MEKTTNSDSNNKVVENTIKSRWIVWLKRICYFIIALYLLIWAASPLVASYILDNFLQEKFGIRLTESSSIRYNPFTSHLTIKELGVVKATKQQDGSSANKTESENKPETLLSLTRLDLELRLHRLLFDEIYLSEFEMNGFSVLVGQQQNGLTVAGVELSKLESNSQPSSDNQNRTSPQKQETPDVIAKTEPSTGLTVKMPLASFSNIKAIFKLAANKHELVVNQWQVENLTLNSSQQILSSKVDILVNQAPLALEFDSNVSEGLGELNLSLDLKDFRLESIQAELQSAISNIKGQVALQSKQTFKLDNGKLVFESPQTLLRLSDLELADKQLKLAVKSHSLAISQLSLGVNLDSEEELIHQPLVIESVNLLMQDLAAQIAENRIESQSQSVTLNSFRLDSSAAATSTQPQYISKFESLTYQPESIRFENSNQQLTSQDFVMTLNDLVSEPNSLSIQQIVVEGLDAAFKIKQNAVVSKEKNIVNNSQQASFKSEKDSQPVKKKTLNDNSADATAQKSTESESSLTIQLDSIRLVDSQELQFIDESISPNYRQSLTIDVAEIKSINSALPNQQSPFKVVGKSEQYTQIDFAGFIKPFTEHVNLSVKGTLSEFSLPPANSYIQNLLGFEIESGELDTKVDIEIVDSQIKGSTGLNIRGLALAKAENYNQDVLKEQTAMPLNMALGMLKDDDDNVELDIPMLGNLDSPTFGVGSFVSLVTKKAIQSAAKSYLITTFLPYSDVISMTISAGEFILKTRFEDLIYFPRQLELAEQQMEYFNQFVALMKDKESTQVKVCGIATRADLPEGSTMESNSPDANNEINNQLKEIALQRMNLFKQAAVEKGVESSRILLCAPKIDLSENSKPRLVLSV